MFQDSQSASEYVTKLNQEHQSGSVRFALGKNDWPEAILSLPSGAHAIICFYGGHLRSWIDKKGREIFFLSENAVYAQSKAVRGGITVLFPYLSKNDGSDPLSDLTSSVCWQFKNCVSDPSNPSITLSLDEATSSRIGWAQPFSLELTFVLSEALEVVVKVKNTSKQETSAQFCLDNYLSTQSIHNVLVRGLENVGFIDNDKGGLRSGASPSKALKFSGGINRVYFGAPQSITVHGTGGYVLAIDSSMPDRATWNPGKAAGAKLTDLPPNGFEKFVCVSSGALENKILLAPGKTWTASQKISLER